MLYMLKNGNATEWPIHGMTTLQASHRNGSTKTHVAKWPKTEPDGQLEWMLHSNLITL